MNRIRILAELFLAFLVLGCQPVQAMTPQQKAKLNELSERTREAGKLYSAAKMEEAAKMVNQIQAELSKVLEDRPSPALLRTAEPIYQKLARAHALLELEGVELDELPKWEAISTKSESAVKEKPVSFKSDVVPILIGSCGNCHVTGNRGRFAMSTYEQLMTGPTDGKVVFAGAAQSSRLIEVIETGAMPKGGGKVSDEQLATLKKWIDQGAKFDGEDPKVRLTDLTNSNSAAAAPATPRIATGTETVSFAMQIAPILRENCIGCHIGGQQAQGGFRMDTFTQLLRGGDSGPVVVPRKDVDSLLIKKLKGQSGQRMPAGGRPALKDEQIELISTWIRENATFDGSKPDANIDTVISTAWAMAASHEELLKKRSDSAIAKWKRVLPNDEPSLAKSDELIVLGNLPQFRIDEIRQEVEAALVVVKKQLGAPANKPLVRGGLEIFVLKNRYDYSEFGKMAEKRELPRSWLGHWYADPVDVYCVLVGEKSTEAPLESVALQVVTAAYLGSQPEVPGWFAEGVARNLVINLHRKDDQRVRSWQQLMGAAAVRVPNAKALLQGELDEEAAGIVGMAITNAMMGRNNKARFNALLTKMRDGKTFTEAMTGSFGPPENFVKSWIGK
jgi:mono/diheme cytochrome c family protein